MVVCRQRGEVEPVPAADVQHRLVSGKAGEVERVSPHVHPRLLIHVQRLTRRKVRIGRILLLGQVPTIRRFVGHRAQTILPYVPRDPRRPSALGTAARSMVSDTSGSILPASYSRISSSCVSRTIGGFITL